MMMIIIIISGGSSSSSSMIMIINSRVNEMIQWERLNLSIEPSLAS